MLAVALGAGVGAAVLAVAGAAAGTVFGTTARVMGRGFGRGTFGAISSFAAKAVIATESVNATASEAESARRPADRNEVASRVTAFLRGES